MRVSAERARLPSRCRAAYLKLPALATCRLDRADSAIDDGDRNLGAICRHRWRAGCSRMLLRRGQGPIYAIELVATDFAARRRRFGDDLFVVVGHQIRLDAAGQLPRARRPDSLAADRGRAGDEWPHKPGSAAAAASFMASALLLGPLFRQPQLDHEGTGRSRPL